MSWTEAFPYLSDDLMAEYDEQATAAERAELEEWLGVAGMDWVWQAPARHRFG